ncbi:hypothetical protein T439DRAFT_328551, partial [Meredithblackwellia eburnea MCA 4105]
MVALTVTAHGSLKRSGVQFLLTQKAINTLGFCTEITSQQGQNSCSHGNSSTQF